MLPTGLKYSSLANRWMPFIAKGTCGVGRSVLPSSSKRSARRDGGRAAGRATGSIPSRDSLEDSLEGTPRATLTRCEKGDRVGDPLFRGMGRPNRVVADQADPA